MAKPNDTPKASFNCHLKGMKSDFLYHIGFSRDEVKDLFHDVKFVVMGGSAKRMASFAELIAKTIGHHTTDLKDLNMSKTDRFSFYKIGPVISVNHGMGVPSVTILLHEILKLLHYAEAKNPIIFRIGTCGGLNLLPGSLVVSKKAVNAFLEEKHEIVVLGKVASRPAILDQDLAKDLLKTQKDASFNTVLGTTMCTDDFYEGQARTDGAFCDISEDERLQYLKKINSQGVDNVEMEATAIASLCYKAGYKCAIICVTLLDRLDGDQVEISPDTYKKYVSRPIDLVAEYIKNYLREAEIEADLKPTAV